ncbi:MAG: hypothetical protein IJ010_01410 [Ruminococcus sp.]|nr:hypothetical protein [Ruminococcus sp.]
MKDKEKKIVSPADDADDRLDIKKSVFEVNKELRIQREKEEEAQQEEIRRRIAEREKKRQEEYDKRILEEKKELMRLKQGIIEESEEIHEETEETVKLTFWKKVGNFFYHNKWWLGIAAVFVFIAVVLTHNVLTKKNPDVIVLVVCGDGTIGNAPKLKDYITDMSEDLNDNGKTEGAVYFIHRPDNAAGGYANGSDTSLVTQLNSSESVIVIGDSKLLEAVDPEKDLIDLSEMFPDNINIRSGRFYLKNTNFADRAGLEESDIPYDLFIAVRKPQQRLYTTKEEMEKTLEKDIPVLEKIISDLSK